METIYKRRSVRKYTETPGNRCAGKTDYPAGMAAPSAKNSQEWVFIVLRDRRFIRHFLRFM